MKNKECPIIFNDDEVRAILDGRKTQARRIVNPQPTGQEDSPYHIGSGNNQRARVCPFGKPGDRLWVREAWNADWCDRTIYRADGGSAKTAGYSAEPKWSPSVHMPREASRITLEVLQTRITRLRDMTVEEALSEGTHHQGFILGLGGTSNDFKLQEANVMASFVEKWEQRHGKDSWKENPWVWVASFKLVE